jgi:hypothetical protein
VLPDLAVDSRDLWIEVLNYTDEISDDTGKWSFTYQLLEADAEDEVFTARVRSDGKLYVVFGDGQSGRIPPSGFTVRAHYRTTIGASASGITNVPPNSLTIIDGSWDVASYASLSDLAITNEAASYGGVDADSLATTRSNTVALTRSQRRAVTARDYEAVALSEGEVLTAYCSAKVWSRPTVWIFPRAPYVLEDATATNDLVSRVQATVDSMAMVGSSVDILMGTPTPLSLTLTVYTWPTLRQSVVKNAIINAITSQYTYENLRFEEGVTEDGILYTISRTVPFRLVRYVVADLVPVFGTQPLDSEVGEPKRYLPQPGELLYIDTDHLTVNIVGGINDLGA